MIIYNEVLSKFISDCKSNNPKIGDIILSKIPNEIRSIPGSSEEKSWNNSLPKVAEVLENSSFDQNIGIAVEYKFETSRSRIDLLIYGRDENNNNSVVIIELKQWSKSVQPSNKKYYVYTYGGSGMDDYPHPSFQSFRYKMIIESFYKFVQDDLTNIQSCSYLHNMPISNRSILNDEKRFGEFIYQSPSFLEGEDEKNKLRSFIKKYVSKPNSKLLENIDNGGIRPSKEFAKMLNEAISGKEIFTLDDNQEEAVRRIVSTVNAAIDSGEKRTIIIKGGPGSGKSIVAINAIGQLTEGRLTAGNKNKLGNQKTVCYCTANFTPRKLFKELLISGDCKRTPIEKLFKTEFAFKNLPQDTYDCIFIDEAHRIFKEKRQNQFVFVKDGVADIFNASKVQVFFIDEDQIVTNEDYLTIDLIKKYADRFKSNYNNKPIELELSSQFRCMGGEHYISFIDHLLGYKNFTPIKYAGNKSFEFKVFDSPSELYEVIKEKQYRDEKIDTHSRLLAGFTHNWVSEHDPNGPYDFDNMGDRSFRMRWNIKTPDITFIEDSTQLDRIGCIHTIQGVDMNYAGVILGKDIVYEDGKVVYKPCENKDDKVPKDFNSNKYLL